jgi:hypothetical protein
MPSSHSSPASTTPFPQVGGHSSPPSQVAPASTAEAGFSIGLQDLPGTGQYQPGSIRWQSAEQPSPSLTLWSSQVSSEVTIPSPQKETFTQYLPPVHSQFASTWQMLLQPSPIAVLPSSHSSPGSSSPSPQMTHLPYGGPGGGQPPDPPPPEVPALPPVPVAIPPAPPLPPLALLLWSHALPSKTATAIR